VSASTPARRSRSPNERHRDVAAPHSAARLSDAIRPPGGRDPHSFSSRAAIRPAASALGILAAAAMLGCGADGPVSVPEPTRTTPAPGATVPAGTGTTALPGSSGSARTATTSPAQATATSTASNCVDGTCTVRVNCNGTVRSRRGPGPVSTSSSSVNGRAAITLDIAGSASDAVVRC
jgi:hypothetical protein